MPGGGRKRPAWVGGGRCSGALAGQRVGGRPLVFAGSGPGKSEAAADLAPLYPDWARFQQARRHWDPDGTFATPYMRRLLGEPA